MDLIVTNFYLMSRSRKIIWIVLSILLVFFILITLMINGSGHKIPLDTNLTLVGIIVAIGLLILCFKKSK